MAWNCVQKVTSRMGNFSKRSKSARSWGGLCPSLAGNEGKDAPPQHPGGREGCWMNYFEFIFVVLLNSTPKNTPTLNDSPAYSPRLLDGGFFYSLVLLHPVSLLSKTSECTLFVRHTSADVDRCVEYPVHSTIFTTSPILVIF